MKNLIYIIATLLLFHEFSCQNKKSDRYPKTHQSGIMETVGFDSHSEIIPLEDIPATVKKEIYNNDLFKGLTISHIVKIKENDVIYYDMTFKDFDGQLIMVYFDEEGKIIVP